jgi:hypothetical protein
LEAMGPEISQSQPSSISRALTRHKTPTGGNTATKEWFSKEQILKQGGPVQNVREARKYLEQNGLGLDDDGNVSKVAEVMLRASSDNSARHGNYLRAFALILENYVEDRIVAMMEDRMGAQVDEMARILTVFDVQSAKIHEVATQLENTDEYIRNAVKDSIDDYEARIRYNSKHGGIQGGEDGRTTEAFTGPGTDATIQRTYASAARQGPANTAPRQSTLDKHKTRGKRIIIDAKGEDVQALTEEALVAKANMAVEMLSRADHPEKPESVEFVSVKKLRNGGMEFELNSEEAAEWAKGHETRRKLAGTFGNSAEIKIQGYTVLTKNAPLYFNPDDEGKIAAVAKANGMEEHDVVRARWMKPPARRHDKQTSAHVALTLRTAKIANNVIRFGVTIRGKRCLAERLTKEASRCNKCQRYGRHFAAQCQAIHDTCGTCASIEHATKDCTVRDDQKSHKCVNCRTTGHAAWSRDCPTFKKKNRELMETSYEGGFKYYVTDEPETWERLTNPNEQEKEKNNEDGRRQQGFNPPHADWGYGHGTLPGQDRPPTQPPRTGRQQQPTMQTTQTTLDEWGSRENRPWWQDQDPIDMEGWDDPIAPAESRDRCGPQRQQ